MTDPLVDIVKSWNISSKSEYRGFRCANCQKYINEAFHHLLNTSQYKNPIHFCEQCENLFKKHELVPLESVKLGPLNFNYSSDQLQEFKQISQKWRQNTPLHLKPFECDKCGNELQIENGQRKGWHVWCELDGVLTELHFCKNCFTSEQI